MSRSGLPTVSGSCQTDPQLLLTSSRLQMHPSCSTPRRGVVNSQQQQQLEAEAEASRPLEETLRAGHMFLLS